MSVKDNITDFIGAAANEKPVAAYNAFSAAVEDKVQGLLDQKQDEIRASMFATEETDLNEDLEELEEDFGSMVMAVVAGNFLTELIGILLAVLFAGAGLGVLKLRDMWDTYKELRADKQAAKELENFAKNSKVIKKVMSSRNALDDLHKNKKANLKGLRGNARKEKEKEITVQMNTLLKELKQYREELKQEIEDADLSDKTLAILKRKGLV